MEELINKYKYLIISISKKFYNIEKEDLYQAGCLGLIKAYYNYQDKNIEFSNYAYKYIFGEMYELVLKSKNIKLTKDCLKLYKLILKTKEYLSLEYEREVSFNEVSAYLNIDSSTINEIMNIVDEDLSLDDEYVKLKYSNYSINEDELIIKDSFDLLDPLSSTIMKYRYLCDYTQSEVSSLLGISQVKVSRIETKSKKKILEYIS